MEFGSRNKIIVLLGPTSSGKSEVAIRLARKLNGEIISADSRQIYKGMEIGTGKVSRAEQKLVRHWMLDIVSPKTEYNVSKFKKAAENIIKDILRRKKIPIICGGTGFWIKAVVDNVDLPEVKPNKMLRNKLRNKSAQVLFKMLEKLDPERAKNIDAKNKVRLIRAIEICKAIGKVPVMNQELRIKNYEFLQIGLSFSKENLHKNIEKRLKKRFRSGMIKEVEKLHKQGLSWKKIQSFGLGYYWIPLYLQKKLDRNDLFEKVYQSEKNYAKRQMTWFKKDKRIVWLKNYCQIEKKAESFIKD